jgi:hypothetical protein
MKKKSYQRPELRRHGVVERVTLGMMGSGGDNQGRMGNMMGGMM